MFKELGQAMTEMVIVLTVLLLLIFGAIQFGLIYNAKITLNYAAVEAARAGAVNNASTGAMLDGLSEGLAPLYTKADTLQGVMEGQNRARGEIGGGRACISVLSPSAGAFSAYNVTDEYGVTAIPNDNLMYRNPGVRPGAGSIQDANLLRIEVNYCYPFFIPFVALVIQRLMGLKEDPDPVDGWSPPTLTGFQQACFQPADSGRYRYGGMPLRSSSVVRMQSPVMSGGGGSC